MEPRRLGQILVAEGLLGDEQLDQALREMRGNGLSFLAVVVKLGLIEEASLANFIAHQFGVETIDLTPVKPTAQARQILPPDLARHFRMIPLGFDQGVVKLAVENPGDVDLDEIKRQVRLPPETKYTMAVAPVSQITALLTALYPAGSSNASGAIRSVSSGVSAGGSRMGDIKEVEQVTESRLRDSELNETLDPTALIAQMEESIQLAGGAESDNEEYSVDAANEAPVRRICNYIIAEASKRRASDIHINPTPRGIVVRYRIDGTLQTMPSPPPAMKKGVIARFKVMAKMNITERRRPQDGRIKIKVYDRTIDLRVSVIPQVDGENIVMRLLDQSSLQLDLRKLGLEPDELALYDEAIHSPYGMILHTGPTGSGKTTTLYSALSTIYDPKKSFVTLEDPVEYELPGIVQVQMDHEVGLDFATALRSALRQDPNVMMLGEIRDKETASIAISAALTGHLLFSTLHTNDAPSTVARLLDIGIEPAYVATAVRLIVAQRLMKRICVECKQSHTPTEEELKSIEVTQADAEGGTFQKGVGCPRCNMTGYRGRVGVYEMMRNTVEIQELIFQRSDTLNFRKAAEAQGMRSLRTLALQKWKAGMTTAEEVLRVTMGGD